MDIIPHPLLLDIVRRVAHHGFRELGSLIASGPDFMAMVFDRSVLAEADIDEFVFVTFHANVDSIYRSFFLRCLECGNPDAQFVEGLRLAVAEGPSQLSVDLLRAACPTSIYARFSLGLILVCSGRYDEGMQAMEAFFSCIPSKEAAVSIAEMVLHQTATFRLPRSGLFDHTFVFGYELPHCYLNNNNVEDLCRRCFVYYFAIRFQELC
ncbi:hypothetical protein ISN44_As04g030130 [Arabidopsis suecica]|uniref:At2g35280-like TPR domain-containing protein n=1 Tax=Arabidopsis suecica TaxID=45249 RepID=A0A8T2EFX4_ARASU|nr:hypothetical protein ISN44_As04g030130 [Arabidopsis suecica]